MELIGKWRVKKTLFPTEEGVAHLTKDEILAMGVEDPEILEIFNATMLIEADGTFVTLVPVPEEHLEEAKAEGAEIDENGCIRADETTWKEVNGEYFFEQDGQSVPFNFTSDGLLEYAMGMMLLEKI